MQTIFKETCDGSMSIKWPVMVIVMVIVMVGKGHLQKFSHTGLHNVEHTRILDPQRSFYSCVVLV